MAKPHTTKRKSRSAPSKQALPADQGTGARSSTAPVPNRGSAPKRRTAKKRVVPMWMWLGGGGIILLVLAPFLYRQFVTNSIEGVQTFGNLARTHTSAPQTYAQTPPVGGPHPTVWQNCGVYDQPIANENGVHSLEHGAVWVTYRPDLPVESVNALRDLVDSRSYTLLSPYPGLPAPVVASAWGIQLRLDDPADPRLTQFIAQYQQGPQTPEPGASCSGGISTTAG